MHGEISGRRIGEREPLFVIAELGLNHGGSVERALAMVDAAADAGVSAVKLQSFTADELVAADCPAPAHVPAASLRDFFRTFELDEAAHMAVRDRARSRGLAFLSTPFSLRAVDMLERVGADGLKIASGDLTYDGLIAAAARTGLPVIMSTGMSSLAETAHAVATARLHGVGHVALLHCVSSYPTPQDSQNLRAIQTLARMFDVPVGLSDHAADTSAIPVAVTLGASIYERHLMLPGDDSVDAAVSSTPEEFAALIALAARTRASLGHGRRECLPAEAMNVTASRRSLHAMRSLGSGDTITAADVIALRPASGLPASALDDLVGTTITRAITAGERFRECDLPAGGRREVA
jgi:N,N'-diacetyllegionaminate synthase